MMLKYCYCVLCRLGVLPEDDPHGVETCKSLNKVLVTNCYNFVHLVFI
jgi:hypothetical protein